jgi:hypothetical protein
MTYNGATYDEETDLNEREQALLDQVRNDQPTTDQPDPRQSILARQERLKAIAEQSGIPLLGGGDIGLRESSIGPGQSSEELMRASYADTPQNQTLSSADLPPGSAITTGPNGFATSGAVPESMTYGLGKLGLQNLTPQDQAVEDSRAAVAQATDNARASADKALARLDISEATKSGRESDLTAAIMRYIESDSKAQEKMLEDSKTQMGIAGNSMLSETMRDAALRQATMLHQQAGGISANRGAFYKSLPDLISAIRGPSEATPIQVGGAEGVRIGDRVTFPPSTASGQMTPFQQESTDIRKKAMTEDANNRRITQLQKSLDSIDMLQAARMSNTPDEKLTPAQRTQKSRYLKYTQELDQLMGNTAETPPVAGTKTETDSSPSKVTTKAQFDALPKGAVYIGKDGKRYRKP